MSVSLFAIAQLDIGAKSAVAQRHLLAAHRILAEIETSSALAIDLRFAKSADGELAREFALRIVGAADKGTELAELERQLAHAAGRAGAWIATILSDRKDVRPKSFIETVEDLGCPQILGRTDGGGKLDPEVTQQLFPVEIVVGHEVEFFLEIGGKIILNIAGEKAFQKGGDETPLSSGTSRFFSSEHIRGRANSISSKHRSMAYRCPIPPYA